MIGTRTATLALGMGLFISLGSLAQDPSPRKPAEKPAAPAKKKEASRRVPDYFGQIGLTPEQRESIYKVRKTHQDKIDVLKKQIADAESQSLSECEAVLTVTQKKLLENLRSGGPKASETTKTAK